MLESEHGFRLRIDAVRGAQPSSIRLALPPRANRASVARALAAGSGVSHGRSGLIVTDPFGVTWTLA